ncbi:MAG: WXG100 family type VII secretion target [Acidimicrobiales bacterium]|nr:WXG100 family type VII secretion target [Actinomycetota bacterium]
MAAGRIGVTPEQLTQISGQVNSGAQSIEGTLANLARMVEPLGAEWQGVAQQRFEELWQKWQTGARDIHQALMGVSQLLDKASAAYNDTESAIARSFMG